MRLDEVGEFGLIRRFAPRFLEGLAPGTVGIGDDCAVLPGPDGTVRLATTDLLLEDVHFLRRAIPPQDVGHKALAVNLSDVAAMGGRPEAALLGLGLPSDLDVAWVDDFFEGFAALAEASSTPLVGGDTTRSQDRILVSVTVLGAMQDGHVKYRSGARPGDVLAVTDTLGDAGAGLRLITSGGPEDEDGRRLVARHHRPRPHLSEGAWLARRAEVRAMLDVSDGIDEDVRRLMEASGVGAEVDLGRLPVSEALVRTATRRGWDASQVAATGGEDYCLLVAVDAAAFSALADAFKDRFGSPLHSIGRLAGPDTGLAYVRDGRPVRLSASGHDHFGRVA